MRLNYNMIHVCTGSQIMDLKSFVPECLRKQQCLGTCETSVKDQIRYQETSLAVSSGFMKQNTAWVFFCWEVILCPQSAKYDPGKIMQAPSRNRISALWVYWALKKSCSQKAENTQPNISRSSEKSTSCCLPKVGSEIVRLFTV